MKFMTETACECGTTCSAHVKMRTRPEAVTRAMSLEYITIGWNIAEGVIAVAAALLVRSVALLGFGIDSFVECASALVLIWRLRAERNGNLSDVHLGATEHRARRLVGGLLFLLAVYVAVDAAHALWTVDKPSFSLAGIVLMIISATVMLWLARAKRRLARELGSQAMQADAFQSTACWWLSLSAITGVGLNGLFGWWWADPLAALVIAGLIVREGREAWNGRACC